MKAFEPKKILKKYWNFDSFRSPQLEIIENVLSGKDTLALLPTGGGKSICFQVPAMCKEGICIVVTPLIALMKDQVAHLKQKGIKAIALHSGMPKRQIDYALDNAIYGNYKFLYVSPERLKSELFLVRLKKMNVNLLAVDEAHCISQWGYDFRPPYLEIAKLRTLLPEVPILALTATATKDVVLDIQEKLEFERPNVIQKSFYRENLRYFVVEDEQKIKIMLSVINKQKGTGIVYLRSRMKTVEYAKILKRNGITADFYHAGLDYEVREKKQSDWMKNKFQVICCTNAFGMGIDKPDVRFVVNVDLPESLEAYFQEAGRGGRDGKRAFAVLLVNYTDRDRLLKRVADKFPELDIIRRIYGLICNELRIATGAGMMETYQISWDDLVSKSSFSITQIINAALFLERAGYWDVSEGAKGRSVVKVIANQKAIYSIQVRYPIYDNVIKVLLRSYSGLFENFAPIREKEIAKRCGLKIAKVIEVLEELAKLELIHYARKQGSESITFLQPRIDMKYLRIPKVFYEDQMKIANQKADAMINYAYNKHLCRSRMLLQYFDEKVADDCGTCDYCINKKQNKALNSSDVKLLADAVKKLLRDNSELEMNEIVNRLKKGNKSENIKFVVQWMLDNGIVLVNENRNFQLA